MLLIKTTIEDLGLLYFWLNKDRIKIFIGDPNVWINEIYEHLKNETDWIFHFLVITDKIPFGFVQFYETHKAPLGLWSKEPFGTVGIDYLIGESEYLNKGYGSKMINTLVCHIKEANKYNSIVADPMEENINSISVLTSNGFIKQRNGLYKLLI